MVSFACHAISLPSRPCPIAPGSPFFVGDHKTTGIQRQSVASSPPPQCTSLTQQTAFAFLHRYVGRQIRLPRFAVVRYTFLHHPTPSLPSQKRQKSKCQHRHNHPALSRRQPAIKRVRDIYTRYRNHPRLTMPPSPAAALPPRQYSQYTPPPASRHPSRPRHPLPPPAARPRPRPRPPRRRPRRP